MLQMSLYLTEKEQRNFANHIVRSVGLQIINQLMGARESILTDCRNFIRRAFRRSEWVTSIMSGFLQEELGLTTELATSTLSKILDQVLEDMVCDVEYKFLPTQVRISVKIRALPIGYQKLLSITGVEYVSKSSKETIPWLEWLVLGKAQVLGYTIIKGDFPDHSRSYRALMVKIVRTSRKSWKLPANIPTTPEHNFLTELFLRIDKLVALNVKEIIGA